MTRVTQITVLLLADEARRGVLARTRRPHDVEIQKPVETHAIPNRATFQPIFEAILLSLQEIPFLRLASVFGP